MSEYYKAVRLDKTSHYDNRTKWHKGSIIRADMVDGADIGPCGHGIHCSPTLLDAVGYQQASSIYCAVEPIEVIAKDETKLRCDAVRVLRWLAPAETDEMAGFKLWEANHPVNPLLIRRRSIDIEQNLKDWDSVWDSVREANVWDSVRASVGDSVWYSVWDSVWASGVGANVWDSVRASVGDSVWYSVRDSVGASVGDSVGAYIGGLFPNIVEWKYVEKLGADPWRPLLNLWYAGYVPSFDGKTWRVHAGKDAKVVYETTPAGAGEEGGE